MLGSSMRGCFSYERSAILFTRSELSGARRVEPAVSVVFEIDIGELHAPTRRSARAAFARQVAMYLSHVACGLSLAEVSSVFARDRSTVAHACELVEDRRDDPVLDAKLEYLERAVGALLGALSLQRGRR